MEKDLIKERLQYAMALREKRAADLCKDLNIPKSTISQYLSGKSKNMTADRLNKICKYLDVSEAWLMGYDVPMERIVVDVQAESFEDSQLNQMDVEFIRLYKALPDEKKRILFDLIKSFYK